MALYEYLDKHFLTKQTLLTLAGISQEKLLTIQKQGVMPAASYRLSTQVSCHSFLGEHQQSYQQEYYAKGYVKWIGIIDAIAQPNDIFQYFKDNYQHTINTLKQHGFNCMDSKLNDKLAEHITEEWQHFLNGTYGLCTASGLVEDIAKKELAITIIKETLAKNSETPDIKQLASAVDLLDQSSALFAPHERKTSSRYRLVDEVREKYQLNAVTL
ncbi:DUF6058 family natural product biosynthesis protein [Thalassotalea sediminis]|uniref:DUF6058 family natural product biosynthesis protein n=1 Tax=Thalassotalea sediminis TaxID=1759089 RepID=UPI0025732147|nr:DUF6058 family natural product biosynthesis protein [Thalassotalea sediminis]